MTHPYIPTTPPPRDAAAATYPKRRRWTAPDAPNRATCSQRDGRCVGICPRHDAENYATHMARHASDVFGTGAIQ